MHHMASRCVRVVARATLLASLVGLAGCPCVYCPKDEDRIEASGVVIGVGALQGATVCADLNRNGDCDPGEPVSASTDAQGRFSISSAIAAQDNVTGLSTAPVASDTGAGTAASALEKPSNFTGPGPNVPVSRPFVAMVPATAVDMSNPSATVGTAYTLRAPEGWGGVISAYTTLIQAGISQRLTYVEAYDALAAQLQVNGPGLAGDYTQPNAPDSATLSAMAPAIVAGLQAGRPVAVSPPAAKVVDYHVRALSFASAGNYTLRYYYAPTAPAGNGLYPFYDVRSGVAANAAVVASSLYDTALLSTAQGWAPNTGSTVHTLTSGSPSVMTYSAGYKYVVYRTEADVAGQPMADVVRQAQDLAVNTFSTLVGVNPANLAGAMPPGAKVQKVTSVGTATPVSYRVSDGFVAAPVATLAGMVAAYPAPSAPTPANTLPMGSVHGSAGCGTTVCPQEVLRVAFPTVALAAADFASYYLCDVDRSTNTEFNCAAAGNGTYRVGKAADGTTPIMTFAALPAAASTQGANRVFVERNGRVYFGYQERTTTATSTRLNKVAFEALAAVLGITPPTINAIPSPYVGAWTAAYTGGDAGSCPTGSINAVGFLTGSCSSIITLQNFTVSGTVSAAGVADFSASGGSTTGARFTGTLSGSAGAGTWSLPSANASGAWTAAKVP